MTHLLFQVLFLSYALILVISFWFFLPLLFWLIFPFLSALSHHFFIRQTAWRGLIIFSDNSMDHCHKILKVEKNALAAQKETGSAS